MRRRPALALPVLALCAAAAVPASATDTAAAAAEPVQTYAGAFKAPTRFANTANPTDTSKGFPGLARRVWLAADEADGVIADVFPVDPSTWGGAFELTQTSASVPGDLDVYFYADMGNIRTAAVLPTSTAEYDTADKGEKGFVPAGTKYAIVFSPDAVNPTFAFKGFAQPEVSLDALDGLSVPAGATVKVVNTGQGFGTLKHLAGQDEQPLVGEQYDGPGRGLRAGEGVSVTFPTAGAYAFMANGKGANVTVTEGPGLGTPAG